MGACLLASNPYDYLRPTTANWVPLEWHCTFGPKPTRICLDSRLPASSPLNKEDMVPSYSEFSACNGKGLIHPLAILRGLRHIFSNAPSF
jgi:hypothetical protein